MKKSILSMSPYRESQKTQNELHLTGDLLASADESFHYAPDFSLDDKSANQTMLRCRPPAVVTELPAMKKASSVPPIKNITTNLLPNASYLSPVVPIGDIQKQKSAISRSLSSAGIQIEKARNVCLSDEDETPIGCGGSGNR